MTDTKATPATDALIARIAADAEIIKAREAAYESAQEGLKSARKQESEMRETIRNQESQARDARVYIANLEAERVALRAQVETLREALDDIKAKADFQIPPACDMAHRLTGIVSIAEAATEPNG